MPGWSLRACHVESVKAKLRNPSSSWTVPGNCSIDLDEVFITVSPTSLNPGGDSRLDHGGPKIPPDEEESFPHVAPATSTSFWGISMEDMGGMGYRSVTEGITAIATSLQVLPSMVIHDHMRSQYAASKQCQHCHHDMKYVRCLVASLTCLQYDVHKVGYVHDTHDTHDTTYKACDL
jgi:hypothetical protein